MERTNLLRFGRFELDPANFQLRRSGRPIRLERIPLEVLLLLVERRGQLVRRQDIADRVWGRDVVLDVDNALNTAIRKVRRALGENPDHPRYVETVAAKGYRFIGAVTSMPRADTEGIGSSALAKVNSPPVPSPSDSAEPSIGNVSAPKGLVEGERKQVTALVAHFKGSMEWLGDRDPEEQRELIDPVLHRVIEAVHRYEGTVNQVTQDGILALFGAPVAHEDHAIRACYAALRMQEAVTSYVAEVSGSEGGAIQVGIGLNTGEMVIRAANAGQPLEPLGVGHTTHVAARLAQLAPSGTILATANMLRLVDGYMRFRSLGPTAVEGLSRAVDVYQLTERGAVRSQLQAAAARGFSKFVGRDIEMMQLQRALEQTQEGRGQAVAIIGDPGVGKSRLVFELTHSHDIRDWLVLEARSVSYGKGAAFLPIIDLLKSYFAVGDRDTPDDIQKNVAEKILALDRALEPIVPALLALLDVPVDDRQWQELDAPQRRQRTMDAVKRILLREAQVRPVLVILEDLHWIDAESRALLDSLAESLPATRLLLLVNYRPEYRHDWGSKTFYTQLRLDTLSPGSTGELLDVLLGPCESLQPLKALLAGTTGGNPFFLEESVRALVETGVLAGGAGQHRLARPIESIQVPATVQAILAARIDRLPPEEKSLLQSASVVGKNVPFALLCAIAEQPEEALRAQLAHLQAAEFLYETSFFPDPEYTFKHALTHEVAYGSVLHERRRALHVRLVEAIETLHPDRLSEHVERLAQHAVRGEKWSKAVTYLRKAAAKAVARSASQEAVRCLQQALGVLARLPESRETSEQAIDLRLDLQVPLNNLGEIEQLLDYLREAEPLAEALGDLHRMGRVAVYMAFGLTATGQFEQVVASGERALAIARTLGDVGLEAQANFRVGQAYYMRGEYSRAIAAFKQNSHKLVCDLQTERFGMSGLPAVMSRASMSWCLAQLGEFPAAMAAGEEAVRIAETADDRLGLILSQFRLGLIHLRRGDPQRARAWLERSLDNSQRFDFEIMSVFATSGLGEARAACGDPVEGLPLLERAAERAASMRFVAGLDSTLLALGEGYLVAGRQAEARQTTERLIGRTRSMGRRQIEAESLRMLGEVHARANPADANQAESSYRQALAIAEQIGMRPLAAHCHLGLGKLYQRTGKQQEAQEHLTTATTMYREMGMTYWLEQAETEMAQLS